MSQSRTRQREAECAAEHCIRERWNVVRSVRAMKTRYARQDLFAADVLGKTDMGQLVAVQVTTGGSSAVAARRRKLEAVPWSRQDVVLLFEYRETREGRKKRYWFRVHEYCPMFDRWAVQDNLIEIPREWFKAWKEEQ